MCDYAYPKVEASSLKNPKKLCILEDKSSELFTLDYFDTTTIQRVYELV